MTPVRFLVLASVVPAFLVLSSAAGWTAAPDTGEGSARPAGVAASPLPLPGTAIPGVATGPAPVPAQAMLSADRSFKTAPGSGIEARNAAHRFGVDLDTEGRLAIAVDADGTRPPHATSLADADGRLIRSAAGGREIVTGAYEALKPAFAEASAGEAGPWHLAVRLAAWGREGDLEAAPAAILDHDGPRAGLQRGALTEWYENLDAGLEHGFTILNPPRGGRGDAPLVLELAVEGDLGAFPTEDGQAIDFKSGDGRRRLRYGGLLALDARGTRLDARLSASAGSVLIRVEARDAVYPITIDPIYVSVWTAEGDNAGALFGYSVETAGDVNGDGYSDVIVGAPYYGNGSTLEGAAFLYLGSASGLSSSPAWHVEGDEDYAQLGISVAAAGDVNGDGYADVAVGVWGHDQRICCPLDIAPDAGAAYVYYGGPAGLPATPSWKTSSSQPGGLTGYSVASAGDVNRDGYDDVIVGSRGWDDGLSDRGMVQVFLGSSSGLATTPVWTKEGNQPGDQLGVSVATAGDVNGDGFSDVLMGAFLADPGSTDSGAAYLFMGSVLGPVSVPAWTATDPVAASVQSQFGISVGPAGDVNGDGYADWLVGAWGHDNGQTDEGAVFLYKGGPGSLSTTPAFTIESNQAGALMGYHVETAGDVNGDGLADFLVGAHAYDTEAGADAGNASLYLGALGIAPPALVYTYDGNQTGGSLGVCASAAGDVNGDGFSDIVIGAHTYDNGQTDEGRAYLYLGGADRFIDVAGFGPPSPAPVGGQLGTSVAFAGDINGDGFTDIVAGAPLASGAETESGFVAVYLGGEGTLPATPSFILTGASTAYDHVGASVAGAGDVNGDGYDDIIYGAPSVGVAGASGEAWVALGSASGPVTYPHALGLNLGDPLAEKGASVAGAGDVNGDGYADVIVGAPGLGRLFPNGGGASVYLGSPGGVATPGAVRETILFGTDPGGRFGASVASAGDVNRDGFSDVLVGCPLCDGPAGADAGKVFLYLGSPSGISTTPAWTMTGDQAGGQCGFAVSTAGDVDRNYHADVVIGCPFDATQYGAEAGRAFVFLGSAAGLPSTPSTTIDGWAPGQRFGFSVAAAGDMDRDFYSDFVVGAPYSAYDAPEQGRVVMLRGSASGVAPYYGLDLNVSGASYAYLRMGWSVAGGGDLNGDGFPEMLAGLPGSDYYAADAGALDVILYNGAGGPPRALSQRLVFSPGPIAVRGRSDWPQGFNVRGRLRSPAGRAPVSANLYWGRWSIGGYDYSIAPPPVDTGAPGAGGSYSVQGFGAELEPPATGQIWAYRTRTRSPFFPRSPWFWPPSLSLTELALRTAGCSDLDGDGYGAWADPLCPNPAAADCDDGRSGDHPGAAEVCDGHDNDCDGSTDEGFGPVTCGTGACQVTVNSCAGGVPQTCVPPTPSPELCDGLDNDCDGAVDDAAQPKGVPVLTVSNAVFVGTTLSWSATPDTLSYDVVAGRLGLLLGNGGDFTTATEACLANDTTATSTPVGGTPAPGDGFWFLARPANACGRGTYDSGAPRQSGTRDPEINGAAPACP